MFRFPQDRPAHQAERSLRRAFRSIHSLLAPEGVPAIGEINTIPGFFLAAGFSGHGFGIGPGAGHLVADLVTGSKPIVDPKSYDPRRFDASAWGKVADF
ncbi:FAD-dependent oxidoreductase [Mesorhizobium calcicola]|uniref:FAD-dependent oxidoreductase n=1 Tax=Mesorhizobium calcicola TaxID=1300310 RepID=A0ABW4WPT7_9HYPH